MISHSYDTNYFKDIKRIIFICVISIGYRIAVDSVSVDCIGAWSTMELREVSD